jgi:molybdopterin biosynthesis enzyme
MVSMLTVVEAQALVLQHARPLPPEMLRLDPSALGLVLAEDVVSDLDMPPYDKSLMDGYAVRATDLPEGGGYRRSDAALARRGG